MKDKIKQKALEENIPILMDDTLEVVSDLLKNIRPEKILEIGTAVGYSAICFSEFLKGDGVIDTIERDESRAIQAINNIKSMGLQDKVNVIIGDAVEVLPTLQNKYDVVFIDAAKGKYPFFLKEALRILNENGVIIADNVLYKGYVMGDYNKHKQRTAVRNLREFLQELKQNEKLEVEILEVGDGLAIARSKQ